MRRIDLSFLLLAVGSLLIGVTLGIWMGIVHDFQMMPVHAHMNLVGWVSLALFGLTYRAYPQMAETKVALGHFCLASVSAFLLPIGIALSITGISATVAIVASFMWLGGVILFVINLVRFTITGMAPDGLPPVEASYASQATPIGFRSHTRPVEMLSAAGQWHDGR